MEVFSTAILIAFERRLYAKIGYKWKGDSMTEYCDLTLKQMVDLAKNSCSELGTMSDGQLVDYETGKYYQFADADTAMFIASARSIVLELAKRIRQLEREGEHDG